MKIFRIYKAFTSSLTAGVDAFPGTTGNDIITGDDVTLSTFDSINGGAGTDTLNLSFIDNTANVAGLSISNVENINFKAAGAVGADAAPFDMIGWTGVKAVSIQGVGAAAAIEVASAASDSVTISAKGVVTLTDETVAAIAVSTSGASSAVDVTSGNAAVTVTTTGANADVVITAADAGAVVVTVAESAVTLTADSAASVSVAGATDVTLTVDNLGAVTLKSAVDTGADAEDAADDTLVAIAAEITTVANTALALNLNGANVTLTATDSNANVSTTDADLTTLNLAVAASTIDNALVLSSDTITTINVVGAGNLGLTVGTATITDINAATATGNISVAIDGSVTNYTGGSGVDTVILSSVPVEAEADNVGTGVFATVIDGGAGTADVVVMSAATAALASDILDGAAFTTAVKGFEVLSLTTVAAQAVDATSFGIDYVKLAGNANGFGLAIANEGTVEFLSSGSVSSVAVAGAVDTDAVAADFSLNLVLTGDVAGIDAGVVTVADVGAISLASNGTAVADLDGAMVVIATNSAALDAAEVTTLTITGDAALNLSASDFTALTTVAAAQFDAALTIDVSSSVAKDADDEFVGVSITVGNGDNNITGSDHGDTIVVGNGINIITGGAGADVITVGNGNNNITGGAGADVITLGTGINTLVYAEATDSTGLTVDAITGFNANATATVGVDEVLGTSDDGEVFSTFDFSGLVAGLGDVTFLGTVANATLANTALFDVFDTVDGFNLQVIYVAGENTLYADVNGSGNIDGGDLAVNLVNLVGTLTQANFDIVAP